MIFIVSVHDELRTCIRSESDPYVKRANNHTINNLGAGIEKMKTPAWRTSRKLIGGVAGDVFERHYLVDIFFNNLFFFQTLIFCPSEGKIVDN